MCLGYNKQLNFYSSILRFSDKTNLVHSVLADIIPKTQGPKPPKVTTANRWPPQLTPLPSKPKPQKVQPANQLITGIQPINQASPPRIPTKNTIIQANKEGEKWQK